MSKPYTTLISSAELFELLGTPNLVVVDCRFSLANPDAGELAYRDAHVPGAWYAHLERDLSSPVVPGKTGRHPLPDATTLAEKLGAWGLDESGQLVVYDDAGGAMAARLWWLSRWLGHDRVAVLDGGYPAWIQAGLPVSDELPKAKAKHFEAVLHPELIADAAEVEAARTDPRHRVFDARALERYRGDVEPIDRIGGHIPGACSLPFAGNLDGAHFRNQEALRERYEAALAGVPGTAAIAYCGSGVTACHTVLAAQHAGIEGVRLYPGSWSEWIVDPERPVARGDD